MRTNKTERIRTRKRNSDNSNKKILRKMEKKIESLGYQNEVDRDTVRTKKEMQRAELSGVYLKNALTRAQENNTIQMTEESKQKILQNWQNVTQGWKSLDIQERTNKIKEFEAELKSEYPNIGQVAGGLWNSLFNNLNEILGDDTNYRKIKK